MQIRAFIHGKEGKRIVVGWDVSEGSSRLATLSFDYTVLNLESLHEIMIAAAGLHSIADAMNRYVDAAKVLDLK